MKSENNYEFKTLNKFEYLLVYDVMIDNKMIGLAFEKSVKAARIINKEIEKATIPEYFEISKEQFKLVSVILMNTIKKKIREIQINIQDKTKKQVILFDPKLEIGKYKKINAKTWNVILEFKGLYQEK